MKVAPLCLFFLFHFWASQRLWMKEPFQDFFLKTCLHSFLLFHMRQYYFISYKLLIPNSHFLHVFYVTGGKNTFSWRSQHLVIWTVFMFIPYMIILSRLNFPFCWGLHTWCFKVTHSVISPGVWKHISTPNLFFCPASSFTSCLMWVRLKNKNKATSQQDWPI